MELQQELQQSFFMRDNSNPAYGKEAILDYEISWVLRITANKKIKENCPKLYSQCLHILCKLLGIESNLIDVMEVKVWKQWEHIDIFSTIKLKNKGKEEHYALLVEDKVYTPMYEHQRDVYPEIAKKWCESEEDWKDCKLRFCAITCYDYETTGHTDLVEFCKQSKKWKWHVFSLEQLPNGNDDEYTESDLFNEFWLKTW